MLLFFYNDNEYPHILLIQAAWPPLDSCLLVERDMTIAFIDTMRVGYCITGYYNY